MDDPDTLATGLEAFVERARLLSDEDRLALAGARSAIDETFHASAWRAANEVALERGPSYLEARLRIGSAFIPDRLEDLIRLGAKADPAELVRWQEVARLVRVALDDALLARLGADRIRPPDLRQLYGPWMTMLNAAHERSPDVG